MLKIKNKTPVCMTAGSSIASFLDNLASVFGIEREQIVQIDQKGSAYAVYFGDVIHIDMNNLSSDFYGFTIITGASSIDISRSAGHMTVEIPRALVRGIGVSFA